MSGPAKCPTCGGRLEGVEPQRLRTRGAAPKGAQLYLAPCPHCGAAVPFAPATANATTPRASAHLAPERAPGGRRRTRARDRQPVGETVRRLLKDEGR
jgi:endogenous inhibitor of DNA gyrase (YacG/DUF329 family)